MPALQIPLVVVGIMVEECSSEFLNCGVLWFNFLKIQQIKLQFLICRVFNCLLRLLFFNASWSLMSRVG